MNEEKPRFSPRALVESKIGKAETNVKTAKAAKRANKKGKYTVKYDADGVKHMILNNSI